MAVAAAMLQTEKGAMMLAELQAVCTHPVSPGQGTASTHTVGNPAQQLRSDRILHQAPWRTSIRRQHPGQHLLHFRMVSHMRTCDDHMDGLFTVGHALWLTGPGARWSAGHRRCDWSASAPCHQLLCALTPGRCAVPREHQAGLQR